MGDPQYMRFPIEEYQARCNKARELMEKKGLKGLFITGFNNFTYFTGGKCFSTMNARPSTMVFPCKGDPVAIIQRFPDWNRIREIWFGDVRSYDTMLGLPLEMAVESMKEKGLDEGRVGVELGYEQIMGISVNDFIKLKEALPKVEFVDAADLFWEIRMIKSPAEIERNRRACEITVMTYDALFPTLGEGMSEGEIMDRFLKMQADLGGGNTWGLINSGPENYESVGGGPGGRRIEKGNQVWIDGGCTYKDYACDFCCAGTVGPASDKQKKMQAMVWEITKAVIDAVRPGMRACEVDALNQAEWEKRGYNYNKDINWAGGRIGHGIGFAPCSNEPPHIAPYDTTVLKPGMIFTIEPGINTEYGCYQRETDCLLTEDGLEILNKIDPALRLIPA